MKVTDIPDNVPSDRIYEFDIYAPPKIEQGFHAAWATLLEEQVPDLIWTPYNGGHWIPTRSDLIAEVLQDYERFSSRCIIIPKVHGEAHGLIPTTIDPPEHHRYRLPLTAMMAAGPVRAMEGDIRSIVVELIEKFADRGECDFTHEFAEILPIRIFLAMMDLPEADTVQTKYWADQLIRPDGSMSFAEAMQKLIDYITPFVDERMGSDGEDMISHLINTEVDGYRLSRDESVKLVVQVLIAGIDTVVNFLGFVFLFLAESRTHQQQIRSGEAEISTVVAEILRRFPLVTIGREVRNDTEFAGVQLKAGDMVATPTPVAGMDNSFNQQAAEVQFDRQRANSLTFGTGAHICPGKNLARAEIRITLEEWFKRIPEFRVKQGQQPTFTSGIVGVVDQLNLEW